MAERYQSFPAWDEEADVSKLLKGEGGKLLREYSNIDPEKMEDHVEYIAKRGWDVLRYPCFQKFLFLHLDLSRSVVYQQIVEYSKAGHLFLDLGCGLGQDLRRLVQDGAPEENLIGLDVVPDFIDLGYQLFEDRSKLTSSFLAQDFFEDTPEIDDLMKRIRVINSGYFMHLWDWKKQLKVATRMIQLLEPTRGAIITGVHLGSHSAGIWDKVPPGFGAMFLHNKETLSELWKEAENRTRTTWDMRIVIEHDEYCRDLDPNGCRLRWTAMRKY